MKYSGENRKFKGNRIKINMKYSRENRKFKGENSIDKIKVKDKQCLISSFTIKYATEILSFVVLVK